MGAVPHGSVSRSGSTRAAVLSAFLLIQSLCAVFFIGDAVEDVSEDGFSTHTLLEGSVAVALVLGVVFGGIEMRHTVERARRAESALSAASGAFADLIASRFDAWGLTPAEADVALLALKGLDVAETARIRDAAAGTVRAQLTRVYAKAGVANRSQFISLFIEDLLAPDIRDESGRTGVAGGQPAG